MEVVDMVRALRSEIVSVNSEQRLFRLLQAWLVILRDAYQFDRKQFTDQQVDFLKQVRESASHIRRFIEVQEELDDDIGLDEYCLGLQELHFLSSKLNDTGLAKRVRKETRQLIERRPEVLAYQEARRNSRLTNAKLTLEENAKPCLKNKNHRMQIRESRNGYFWGCSAFPSCLHTQRLSPDEAERLETV